MNCLEVYAEPLGLVPIYPLQPVSLGCNNGVAEHPGQIDTTGDDIYPWLSVATPATNYIATSIENSVETRLTQIESLPFLPEINPLSSISDSPLHLPSAGSLAPRGSDRSMTLDDKQRLIFKGCGPDPKVQNAVLCILRGDEYRTQHSLSWPLVSALFELIPYENQQGECIKSGKGCRGAPEFYQCRWGNCRERLRRRLHALEHLHNHVGIRPFICTECRKGFVRKNELMKHSPCKAIKKTSVSARHISGAQQRLRPQLSTKKDLSPLWPEYIISDGTDSSISGFANDTVSTSVNPYIH